MQTTCNSFIHLLVTTFGAQQTSDLSLDLIGAQTFTAESIFPLELPVTTLIRTHSFTNQLKAYSLVSPFLESFLKLFK